MLLRTENLTKQFKSFKAVDGLSLNVPEGSVYGFLGPNGAGKTTTIKVLTGLSSASKGKIFLKDIIVNYQKSGLGKSIGYLPDVPNYYDWMNAKEFLKFCGDMIGLNSKNINSQADSMLKLTGLAGVNKKIGTFSRGMKQRLGIAQALLHEPEIVILDEPTSALDPIGRKDIMDLILLLKGKVTVFFSTHILSDIERVCTHAGVIFNGKLVAENTLSDLKSSFSENGLSIIADSDTLQKISAFCIEKKCIIENSINNELIVKYDNIPALQSELFSFLSQNNLTIDKLHVLKPGLEDIFLKLIS